MKIFIYIAHRDVINNYINNYKILTVNDSTIILENFFLKFKNVKESMDVCFERMSPLTFVRCTYRLIVR